MKKEISTYTTRESVNGEGIFYYCGNCKNRMFSITGNKMLYHGAECPKCGKILYYRPGVI